MDPNEETGGAFEDWDEDDESWGSQDDYDNEVTDALSSWTSGSGSDGDD